MAALTLDLIREYVKRHLSPRHADLVIGRLESAPEVVEVLLRRVRPAGFDQEQRFAQSILETVRTTWAYP